MKWSVMLTLAIALVAMSSMNCAQETVIEEGDTYNVGALFSTTGPASNLGVPEENTVEMMVDQINDAGGINGHPLEVTIYNDETKTEKCATLANTLIEDGMLAIIGPTTSGNSLAILDTITTAEIPLVSCAATIGIVQPVEDRYWIFKTPQSDKEAITEIYTYLEETANITNIALITATSGYGTTGRGILIADAPDFGLTVVDDQTFAETDTSMQSQLTHIGGTDAEAVVCWATDKESASVAKDMQTLQMAIPLYCSHGIANQAFITAAGDAANGVIFPAGKLLIADDLPDSDPQKEVLIKYRDDYEALDEGTISTFGGHAWDALQMVIMALEGIDEGLNIEDARAAVRDGLEGITDFVGVSGVFTMSPTNHLGMAPGSLVMYEIVDGEWTWLQ